MDMSHFQRHSPDGMLLFPESARQEWKQKSSFMSPRLEEIVVFAIAAILVALFAWIYVRDPQKTTRLWMLGWIAVLVHFAAPALDNFFPQLMNFTWWLRGTTLIVAGTFF